MWQTNTITVWFRYERKNNGFFPCFFFLKQIKEIKFVLCVFVLSPFTLKPVNTIQLNKLPAGVT